MNRWFLFVIFLAVTLALDASAWAESKIELRVLVVDEQGAPVEGAVVRGFFFDEQIVRDRQDGNLVATTGADGHTVISGTEDIYVDVLVTRGGYYTSQRRVVVRDPEIRKNGSDETILLRPVVDPIEMHAKQETFLVRSRFGGEPYGYDLMVGDFVAPLGRGQVNDLLLKYERVDGGTFDWSWKLSVAFANPQDGLIPVEFEDRGSEFRSDYRAPPNGYLNSWMLESARTSMDEPAQGNTNRNRSYYFRIRTRTDASGNVFGGHYGKIYGEFPKASYYVNPSPGDRNVEWDPSKNALSPLPPKQRVLAP